MSSEANHILANDMNAAEELMEEGADSVAEAVAFSGYGRTRLYGEMGNGRLAYIQKGAKRLIPRKALKKLMAEDYVSNGSVVRDCL